MVSSLGSSTIYGPELAAGKQGQAARPELGEETSRVLGLITEGSD